MAFHLVIDALKLNGITTIYGVPGIPITDFGRMAQAEGNPRYLVSGTKQKRRQCSGNCRLPDEKNPESASRCRRRAFLNGLTALANATTNCFPMILILGLVRA